VNWEAKVPHPGARGLLLRGVLMAHLLLDTNKQQQHNEKRNRNKNNDGDKE
jgi:hypothetical protein